MSSYRVDFNALPWQAGVKGLRFKDSSQHGTVLRVVEYTRDMEPHWCAKGHVGYVLEGRLEVKFKGEVVIYGEGEGVFIPSGEDHEHMGRALTDVVRMVFVEMDTDEDRHG